MCTHVVQELLSCVNTTAVLHVGTVGLINIQYISVNASLDPDPVLTILNGKAHRPSEPESLSVPRVPLTLITLIKCCVKVITTTIQQSIPQQDEMWPLLSCPDTAFVHSLVEHMQNTAHQQAL